VPQELTVEELRVRFDSHGQGHVLAQWDKLDSSGRDRLLTQLARLEPQLGDLAQAFRQALPEQDPEPRVSSSSSPSSQIEPAEAIALPENGGDPERAEEARKLGEKLLEEGRVGVFLVAGGQGTRLGFPHPKGCFPIGPVSERSLFEIQAQKIRGLVRRSGRAVPWYILTSDATDAETRAAFEANDYFGLPEADVQIFQQDMVPAFGFDGRLILESPDRVFENPNGHGGSLTALESSGALDDMDRRGIDTIFYYQVDNPLVKIADPTYLGFHAETGAEMSCKVTRKVDPMEKVGVVARVDDRLGIVEYTELEDSERYARDDAGQLRFWAGSIAIHLLSTDFVRRVAADSYRLLPFHLSAKQIPYVDDQGQPQKPDEANGYKLERFVFDALAEARSVCVVETSAADEFSPVKNASGVDSADSCRAALGAQYRRWLAAGGIDLPDDDIGIEVDHSVIDGPDDVRAAGFKSLAAAGQAVQIAGGRER
jgi:UDP-N-acetylglucosamine/UDP-N-acetylgalactosamine diphosphorylase